MHSFAKNGYPLYYFEDLFIKKDKQQAQDLFDYIELPLLEDDYEEFINSDTHKIRLTKEEKSRIQAVRPTSKHRTITSYLRLNFLLTRAFSIYSLSSLDSRGN